MQCGMTQSFSTTSCASCAVVGMSVPRLPLLLPSPPSSLSCDDGELTVLSGGLLLGFRGFDALIHLTSSSRTKDGELLSEYAKLVWEMQRDEEGASSYLDRSDRASRHKSDAHGFGDDLSLAVSLKLTVISASCSSTGWAQSSKCV